MNGRPGFEHCCEACGENPPHEGSCDPRKLTAWPEYRQRLMFRLRQELLNRGIVPAELILNPLYSGHILTIDHRSVSRRSNIIQ